MTSFKRPAISRISKMGSFSPNLVINQEYEDTHIERPPTPAARKQFVFYMS